MAPKLNTEADMRLKAIADRLGVPVAVFYDEPSQQDPSLDDLFRAFIAAAEAYTQGVRRAAQSVTLAGGA
jgi:hypothetical protein